MRFAHIADCHVGAWRDPLMKKLTHSVFEKAIDKIIKKDVDFLIIAGDLFNTAVPSIDSLRVVVRGLSRLREKNIRVYAIAGSHDFSPSGKTILHVLEEAELIIDVSKGQVNEESVVLEFTEDKKTKAKLTGIIGRRGSLDKHYYKNLNKESLEKEKGFKIFIFHTPIKEMCSGEFENTEYESINTLPKGFDYYAGGHLHIVKEFSNKDYPLVVYPGPLFPVNFSELERIRCGGIYFYEDGELKREEISVKEVKSIFINGEGKVPSQITEEILSEIKEVSDKIVLVRIEGKLSSGKTTDINFRDIIKKTHDEKAYFFMKNTTKLTSPEIEEPEINIVEAEDIERLVIKEYGEDEELIKSLFRILGEEIQEGERVYSYEERIIKEAWNLLEKKKLV